MKVLFIIYDNESYISHFPLGAAYLVAYLERYGHAIDLYHQDIHHFPETHLTRYLDEHEYDVICLGFIGGYWQYKKALAISNAVNASKKRPFFVLGGHGPSPEPEFFMRKTGADAVCIGEGEETLRALLDTLASNSGFENVLGLAWRDGSVFQCNKRRPLISDIDSLPFPAYHRFPMHIYRLLRVPNILPTDFVAPMLSGRGCTFKCNFCYRMDEGFRPRKNEGIIEEMRLLATDFGITYIDFCDELLMSSVERTTLLCEDIIRSGLGLKWACNGRLNYARPDLMRLMKRAGCVFVNYGIEAFDDRILQNMNKSLTTRIIEDGIKATLNAGISPGFNIIFGNIGENRETLFKGVEFLLRYDDGAQLRTIRPVTPYPGSPLYYQALASGQLRDCDEFYEKRHLNSDLLSVNFTEMSDEEYYCALADANSILLDNYQKRATQQNRKLIHDLYYNRNATFRGFRHT